jgi:hypothetical protein
MILIYTDKITNRIKYIFNLLFNEILNIDFELTKNQEDFNAFDGVKFSYTKQQIGDELYFHAENLLFDRGISHIDLTFIKYEELPAFFPVYIEQSALPFDPFAAGFYLVSRYEEYLPYRKDEYGRFSTSESIAYQKDFLHKPLVNIWANKIGEILKQHFASFKFTGKKYEFIPTIDIDAAWAYKQKGVFRTLGGYINGLIKFDFTDIAERTKVLLGIEKDPFDTYDFQLKMQKKYNIQHIYFILFAEYGFNDKNTPIQSQAFHKLIKSLADYAEVGIHPSYNSNSYPKKLNQEINRLSKVLNREITKSRQHFLKLQFPTTYRNLINLDITDDYSMGFAAKPGFRAGICSSFNFYDLDLDTETNLRVHPFTFMEGTLRDYMNVEADQAMEVIKPLIDEVKAVSGTFISLWHNESLSNAKRWKGWQQVYEEMIREALP